MHRRYSCPKKRGHLSMSKINSNSAMKYIIVLSGLHQTLLIALAVPDGLSLLKVLITWLLLLSGFFLIVFFLKMRGRLSSELSFYTRIVYSMLLAWSIVVIVRSVSSNPQDLITLAGNNEVGWVWLAPLAIVFGLRIEFLISLIHFLLKLCAFSTLIFFVSLVFLPENFALSLKNIFATSIFLVLSSYYFSSIQKLITLGGVSCLLIISYVFSIRIYLAIVLATSYFFFLIYLFHHSSGSINQMAKKISIFVGLILYAMALVVLSNALKSNETMTTDTRTFLFVELFADMSPGEEIIGRGALGKYYSPYFAELEPFGI